MQKITQSQINKIVESVVRKIHEEATFQISTGTGINNVWNAITVHLNVVREEIKRDHETNKSLLKAFLDLHDAFKGKYDITATFSPRVIMVYVEFDALETYTPKKQDATDALKILSRVSTTSYRGAANKFTINCEIPFECLKDFQFLHK